MKTIPNSPVLKAWLSRNRLLADLAKRDSFVFEDDLFAKAAHIVAVHHPEMNQASVEIRAALQLLAGGHPGEAKEAELEAEQETIVDSLEVRLPKWVRPWAIAIFLLLCIIAFAAIAKAEPEPANAVPQSQVLAAFHSNPGVLAQFGGIVIQLQNGGSTLATRGGGLVIFNCTGSGLSCSFSGSTFTMNGSGGGGSGCVPPGTVTDALLYDSGSGTCPDVTKWTTNGTTTITAAATAIFDARNASELFVPSSGGCAPTISALACYDSMNHVWTFGSNGTTVDLCNTQGGNAGQVFESNGGTSCGGYADPVVSGPDAPGAASTKNPVQVAGNDGTDVRAIATDTSGDTKVTGLGTAGSAAGGVVTVQGVASMTKLLVTPDSVALPNHQSVNVDEIGGSALAIGQQLAAASIPVILPSATITTLTPPTPPTAAAIGTSVSGDLLIGTQVAGSSVPVALPTATITTLTPPTAAAVGTSVSGDLLIGTQVAGSSVPVALPTATITSLTPPTAAAIASAIVSNPPTVPVTQATGTNLHMVCDSGCSSSAGFADNSAFTVGTTAINPIGGLYDSGADPTLSTGNAARARIDAHSYLGMDIFGVAGSAIGATNPLFDEITDGTNAMGAMNNFGTTPGAVKALNVNSSLFQGTTAVGSGAPLQVTGANGTFPVTGTFWQTTQPVSIAANVGVTQQTSPWVDSCTAANCAFNLAQSNGTALGTPNTFGASAPTGNALGVNASVFVGTNLLQFGQASMTGSIPVVIASNQSNLPTADTSDGTVSAGTVATTSALTGCIYRSPNNNIPTNGQQSATTCDQYSRELVTEPQLEATLNQMLQMAMVPGKPLSNARLVGTFNQPIQSTAGALNVNVQNSLDQCNNPAQYRKQFGTLGVTGSSQLITGEAGMRIYFCQWNDLSASAENYAVVEGTGSTCGTNTAAVGGLSGGTTAANGWNVSANGGRTMAPGNSSVGATFTPGDNVCILLSGSTLVSGGFAYVFAP